MLEEKQIPWRSLLETLARRKGTVLLFTLLGLTLALVSALLEPPLYQATATLALETQRGRLTVSPSPGPGVTVERATSQQLNRQVTLLRSPALVREALAREPVAGLAESESIAETSTLLNPAKLIPALYAWIHETPATSPYERKVKAVLASLEVTPNERASLIEVAYTGGHPESAAHLLNSLLQTHIERSLRLDRQSEARLFLEQQRAILGDKLNQATAELDSFRRRSGVANLPPSVAELKGALARLENEYAAATTALREINARVGFLQREIAQRPIRIDAEQVEGESAALRTLRDHLLDLELKRTETLSKYAASSTVVRELDRQIEAVRERLSEEQVVTSHTRTVLNPAHQTLDLDVLRAQAEKVALEARTQALEQQIGQRRQDMNRLQAIAPELERLETQVENANQAYENYLRKEEEARFAAALDESRIINLTILEPATPPTAPTSAGLMFEVLIPTVLFFVLGVAAAFARDSLDPALKSTEQAERITGLRVIADIPS